MAKTVYTQESKLGWLMVTHSESGLRELIQVNKLIGVREDSEGCCRVKYYSPIENRTIDIFPEESFEEISEQLGIEFEVEHDNV